MKARVTLGLTVAAAAFLGVIAFVTIARALGTPVAIAVLMIGVATAFVKFNETAGQVLGGAVAGTLTLLAFNVVLAWVWTPGIKLGLVFAFVVFSAGAGWYLYGTHRDPSAPAKSGWRKVVAQLFGRGSEWGKWSASSVALALAALLILVLPVLLAPRADRTLALALVAVAVTAVVGGQVAWCLTQPDRDKEDPLPRPLWAGIVGIAAPALGVALLIAVPAAVRPERVKAVPIAERENVRSQIHLRIVSDGSVHEPPSPIALDPGLNGFDVRYSVGVADGTKVRWTLTDTPDHNAALAALADGRTAEPEAPPPAVPASADSLLMLLVDGTEPVAKAAGFRTQSGTDVDPWEPVRDAAGGTTMPTFVALETEADARLARWKAIAGADGDAVSLQRLGRPSVTEAALALAIESQSAMSDLILARDHRPILLFDSDEPVARAVSIDWLFHNGKIRQCDDEDDCGAGPVPNSGALSNGGTHLRIDQAAWDSEDEQRRLRALVRHEAEDAKAGRTKPSDVSELVERAEAPPEVSSDADRIAETAIYVHAVPDIARDGSRLLYLDYWWFLPDNPVAIGGKAFCGPGMVIPGVTCHNHESDWEGVTVVLNRSKTPPAIQEVHYAQHSHVVRFKWEDLAAHWKGKRYAKFLEATENGSQRPLAFAAAGTHATYPFDCRDDCKQFADAGLGEDRHDGGLPWLGNYTNTCGSASCLQRIPTRVRGIEPALWNAFTGPWGSRNCAFGYYCDLGTAPSAPGMQPRYERPQACDGSGVRSGKGFKYESGGCSE